MLLQLEVTVDYCFYFLISFILFLSVSDSFSFFHSLFPHFNILSPSHPFFDLLLSPTLSLCVGGWASTPVRRRSRGLRSRPWVESSGDGVGLWDESGGLGDGFGSIDRLCGSWVRWWVWSCGSGGLWCGDWWVSLGYLMVVLLVWVLCVWLHWWLYWWFFKMDLLGYVGFWFGLNWWFDGFV